MLKTSVRFLLASAAAGSLFTAAAPAMAYGHVLVANDFIANAVINETGSACAIDWVSYEGHTLGASFFIAVLAEDRGWAASDVVIHWGMNCPSSPVLYTAIGNGTYFTQISNVGDILPDDVVVINSTIGGASGTYSGHTMMIDALPTVISPQIKPFVTGTSQWRVHVIDSTTTAHGCTDSRWSGACTGGTMDPGAGSGEMRIYANSTTGALAGYTWSVTSSTTSYYAPEVRPYRVGRLTGLLPPAPLVE